MAKGVLARVLHQPGTDGEFRPGCCLQAVNVQPLDSLPPAQQLWSLVVHVARHMSGVRGVRTCASLLVHP